MSDCGVVASGQSLVHGRLGGGALQRVWAMGTRPLSHDGPPVLAFVFLVFASVLGCLRPALQR